MSERECRPPPKQRKPAPNPSPMRQPCFSPFGCTPSAEFSKQPRGERQCRSIRSAVRFSVYPAATVETVRPGTDERSKSALCIGNFLPQCKTGGADGPMSSVSELRRTELISGLAGEDWTWPSLYKPRQRRHPARRGGHRNSRHRSRTSPAFEACLPVHGTGSRCGDRSCSR